MKVKLGPISLSNKKKNALPQSKLLKPKKLKPSNKIVKNQKISEFKKEKLCLAIKETELTKQKTKPKKKNVKIEKDPQGLENRDIGKTSVTAKVYKPTPDALKKAKVVPNISFAEDDQEKNNNKEDGNECDTSETKANVIKQLNLNKVAHAVDALLKLVKQDKKSVLDLPETIFMEVECIKIPICPTKQLRFKLPHPLVDDMADVLLITADKKGAKIYPDKAVDYYTELLAKHDINFIQKVIPLRSVTTEYSQYEMRKKLVNQYDLILADARIIKSLPSRLGKSILYNRKMPIPVQLNRTNLKQHLLNAISKTQMTVKGTGHKTTVKVGHTKMAKDEVAENILAVSGSLNKTFPGGWKNIRALDIKTAKSIALPVYFSFASPNSVEIPEEKKETEEPVEGELSTMMFTKVIVNADGTVRTKRIADDKSRLDDSKNDEILEEVKQFMESRKTIRHDDNSDSDEEEITSAMEKEVLQNYNKLKEEEKENEEEVEEKGEESSDEDEPVPPIFGQKRNKKQKKNQGAKESPNKKQKKLEQQGKLKGKAGKKEVQQSDPKKGLQKRGSRGGKKNLNKHQRKAMLKKKGAGKK